MRIVVLHGSSHRGGNSDTLVDRFLSGMGGEGKHDVRHFYPIDMTIAHCRGCGRCQAGSCVIDDDMKQVYPAFAQAEIVVVAAPMFWGYMTSQLKTLFDRLEAICGNAFSRKDFVLFVTYRHYYGSMVEWLGRITKGFDSRMHAMTCQTYDPETERDIPIAHFPSRLQEAFDLGLKVAALPRLDTP